MKKYYIMVNKLFNSPIQDWKQIIIILCSAFAFIFMPQLEPIDWNLNTEGFWTEFPHSYTDPTKVYPPWGLILMLPYYWMGAAGARILSVIVVGFLAKRRNWTIIQFFIIVLSPYFFVTMSRSNMDIFTMLLPILIWEIADGKQWQTVGWSIALSLSLLKPQGMVFIWLYWLFSTRRRWKDWIKPFVITSLIVVPISLVGKPPLIFQWIENLIHPDPQNKYYWSINNLSMTARYGLLPAVGILTGSALLIWGLVKREYITWSINKTYSVLLLFSFFLMPYASQQSLSSAFALLPSIAGWSIQIVGVIIGLKYSIYLDYIPFFVLVFSLFNLIFYKQK